MIKAAIITASDTAYRGERTDESAPVIKEILEKAGYEVTHYVILADDIDMLSAEMARIADEGIAELLITTGGTGFSPRDVTPEATKRTVQKEVPGIPEAMRAFSMKYTKRSMLSRAAAGIRKSTLIINLPGSPKACRENLEYVIDELSHGLGILTQQENNCAR